MHELPVTKCQATGNDFLILDERATRHADHASIARLACSRRFGIGADGLLVLQPPLRSESHVRLSIYNADGSEARSCGNGLRCVARYCFERADGRPRRLIVETPSGIATTEIIERDGRTAVRAAMGPATAIDVHERPRRLFGVDAWCVDVTIGNEHRVAFVDVEPNEFALDAAASALGDRSAYPDGVNVEVVKVTGGALTLRVHERGVGETWACGTGACAAVIAAVATKRASSPAVVSMPGGDVQVEWSGRGHDAYLTGEAEIIFDTSIDLDRLAAAHSTAPIS
ncbi:MAG TPA: diaminopimelate epimerase [Candidatus Eremiobacteraceae bacterium]|nr:diaminopimelate epimerase [Candidatus Eremiobacteraceae bacterium]